MSEPDALPEADFRAIETALRRTARGRAFLSDVVRRNRAAETRMLLDAVTTLERSLLGRALGQAPPAGAEVRTLLAAVRESAPGTDAAGQPGGRHLDRLLASSRESTGTIRAAAERVQDLSWTMRESGLEPKLCDTLDRDAAAICRACDGQEHAEAGFARLGDVLRHVEREMARAASPSACGSLAPSPSTGGEDVGSRTGRVAPAGSI